MMQKDKTRKRKGRKGRLAVVAALALVLGALPAQKSYAVSLDGCTVTVNSPTAVEGDTTFAELSDAGVILDFYQVARAEALSGFDAYKFSAWNDPFRNLETEWEGILAESEEDGLKADDVNGLTQRLAGVVLAGVPEYQTGATESDALSEEERSKILVTHDGTLDNPENVDAGLYLIIPHGNNVTDYKVVTETASGTTYSMLARGRTKLYQFAPILVSVPTRGNTALDGEGIIADNDAWTYQMFVGNTADTGEWEKNVKVKAKVGEGIQVGKLQLTKELTNYETLSNRTDSGTFVFSVDAVYEGKNVYSDVVSMAFTGAGTSDPVTIGNLPVGALVTIQEIYTGGNYEYTDASANTSELGDFASQVKVDDKTKSIVVPVIPDDFSTDAEEMVKVSFVNDYTDTFKDGGSVENHFKADTDGENGPINWKWEGSVSTRPTSGSTQE